MASLLFGLIDYSVYYLTDVMAYGYPGLMTLAEVFKAGGSPDPVSQHKWLKYWVIFAAFIALEFFLSWLLNVVTMGQYHYLRFAFLLYLALGGAEKLYNQHIKDNKKYGEGVQKFLKMTGQ